MNFQETFPECYLLNLARRGDRRTRCEFLFEAFGLRVGRFPAVDAIRVENFRGFEDAGRYAHAISTRLIIREAKRRGDPAVFIFEDDVVLHAQFHEQLGEIELPDDWGMFYLGAQHHVTPEVVGKGLVRVKGALDTHAWGVRAEHYDLVLRALAGKVHPAARELPPADVLLAKLQQEVPTYAVFPNLAWQMEDFSDLAGGDYSNYRSDGSQVPAAFMLRGIHAACAGAKPWTGLGNIRPQEPFYERWYKPLPAPNKGSAARKATARDLDSNPPPQPLRAEGKIALLFVTVGEHRHPDIWQDYWSGSEEAVSVYAHTSGRDSLGEGWLNDAQIEEEFETAWAHVTTLRVQIELLKLALADERNEFFAFLSESCLPVRPLAELRQLLQLDGRSRFGFARYEEMQHSYAEKAKRALGNYRLPATQWRFQSQWVFLNRELAELICEDDFLEHFEDVFAPDEAYFGTVANLKGYPLESRVANRDMTWLEWERQGVPSPKTYKTTPGRLQSELMAAGVFFARKFDPACDLSGYRIHLSVVGAVRPPVPNVSGSIREVVSVNRQVLDGSDPPGLRQPPRPEHQREGNYEEVFDHETLWSDVFHSSARRGQIQFVAPPLLNLEPWFGAGSLVDERGGQVGLQRQILSNCEIWEGGTADQKVAGLEFRRSDGGVWNVSVGANHCDLFEGRRAIVTMVKNDRLEWVGDWVEFYAKRHGVDAVLLYNNQSADHDSEQLLNKIGGVPGIEVAVVVPWEDPYGPDGGDGIPWDSNYAQATALEHAHHRFLQKARGVIGCDVDELIVDAGGRSVFDLCEASATGYLQIRGRWCYCLERQGESWPEDLRHRHHFYNVPEWGASCPDKWVIAPWRLDKGLQWSVHQLVGGAASGVPGLEFRHMRGISTNWKHDRTDRWTFDPDTHSLDEELRREFDALGWD